METFVRDGVTYQRWRVGASTYVACMQLGARLMSWDVALPTGNRSVIYWPATHDLAKFGSVRGGNPVLFPFAGRCHVGGVLGHWVDPEGVKRPMPAHGFVRQGACEITATGTDFVEARLTPDAAAHAAYPYAYDFYVRYEFGELGFRVEFRLENRDAKRMPWGPGHHFYFTLPWHQGLTRKDYVLKMDAKKAVKHATDGSFLPEKDIELPVTFDHPRLSDTLFTKLKSDTVLFGPQSGEEDIRLTFAETPAATTALVTWTEHDTSPFYCVEPWVCLPNAPANKFEGCRWVEPGCADRFVCRVELA